MSGSKAPQRKDWISKMKKTKGKKGTGFCKGCGCELTKENTYPLKTRLGTYILPFKCKTCEGIRNRVKRLKKKLPQELATRIAEIDMERKLILGILEERNHVTGLTWRDHNAG